MQRTNAIRTLIGLLERPEVNIYHKALISNLLAHAGDDDGLEVDEYAYECIALCNKIITHEDLAEGSNARQPFDDMITRARDMLKALSDDEDRTRTAYVNFNKLNSSFHLLSPILGKGNGFLLLGHLTEHTFCQLECFFKPCSTD